MFRKKAFILKLSKKSTKKLKKILIYGFHAIENLILLKPHLIINIYLDKESISSRNIRIRNLLEELKIKFIHTEKKHLDKISGTSKHQGFVAEISLPEIKNHNEFVTDIESNDWTLVLILDSINDPRNLGACMRSAYAFGVDAVVINTNASSPINDLVIKSSVGSFFSLNVYQVVNLSRSIDVLKKSDFWVAALDVNSENEINLHKFHKKTAIIMGSEEKGVRKLIKEKCDHLLKIPMQSNIESLNVSVATAISLFEVNRQKKLD